MTLHIHIDKHRQTKRLISKPRYRNMPSRLPTPPLLLTTMMMALAVAITTTPSCVSAFLMDTGTVSHPHQTLRPLDQTAPRQNVCQRRITTQTQTTRLEMAVTKSGGRPILSEKQFQTQILLLDDDNRPIPAAATATATTKPILVFYSAPWCGPCRLSNPVVKEIIRAFVPLIDVVEVCTDDLPEIAEVAGVVSIPTIQFYYGGELLDTIVGCVAKNVLGSAVRKILEDLGCWDDGVDGDEDEEVDGDGGGIGIGVG